MLVGLPEDDREQMTEDERIEVRCEFCNELYEFEPDEAFAASAI
jgi:redox-regulated HSP33 family molecular chaperone